SNDKLVTEVVEQEGPIAYVESTTRGTIDAEDANRCLLLNTDERAAQTELILNATADAAAGGRGVDVVRIRAVHHALQRMLPRAEVVIPFAGVVADLFPKGRVEVRRDFRHLVQLVKAITLLHFRQRERTTD